MAIRIKWGGPWIGPIADGNLRTRWGGGWISPAYVNVKANSTSLTPPYGGNWVDTGYRGYPNPPQSIWVHAWSFTDVALGFTGPAAGGAPVAYYHLVQTDSSGNWLNQVNVGGSPWGNFGVGEDGYYAFFVRSISTSGLASAFAGPVRVKIGHSEQGYWANENRTRDWYSQLDGANWYKDAYDGSNPGGTVVWVPSSVEVYALHYDVWANNGFSSVLSPWGNRILSNMYRSTDMGNTIQSNNPLQGVYHGAYGNGGDGWWGIVARGAGWTVSPGGTARCVGAFGVQGTETYGVTVYYRTRDYLDNGYW